MPEDTSAPDPLATVAACDLAALAAALRALPETRATHAALHTLDTLAPLVAAVLREAQA